MIQSIPDKEALRLINRSVALRYRVIPLGFQGTSLRMAFAQNPSANDLSDLIFLTGMFIDVELVTASKIEDLIDRYLPNDCADRIESGETSQYEHRAESFEVDVIQGRIVDTVNSLISRASSMGASDIHLEPSESGLLVRLRIDGVLQNIEPILDSDQAAVISRIKLMSGMDIAEKRRPQDGRITMQGFGDLLDIRVSSVPSRTHEKVVLRLLNKSEKLKDLAQLGMNQSELTILRRCLCRPQGMILVSGPTGSGKSTTLYAALNYLSKPGVNLMTIEDPIEYEVQGITQSQVKPEINYDFATALRAFLRQDPDIIMVGEIRDQETARIGLRAAMTGHLVLSTVHTNDAASTITRLLDIGIEPYLVASSISLIVAQRLLRRVCPRCHGDSAPGTGKPKECKTCNSTGYKGRIGVFELLEITEEIRAAIHDQAPEKQIAALAGKLDRGGLYENAMNLVKSGQTTVEEVRRVL